MTERTTSILFMSAVLIAILGAFVLPLGPDLADLSRFINAAYIIDIFAAWFFLAMKLTSKLAPLNFKWESLSRNEGMFCFFYIFLTKEAREEWSGYISEKKK